eukprot:3818460-Amphidinium_carterae.1
MGLSLQVELSLCFSTVRGRPCLNGDGLVFLKGVGPYKGKAPAEGGRGSARSTTAAHSSDAAGKLHIRISQNIPQTCTDCCRVQAVSFTPAEIWRETEDQVQAHRPKLCFHMERFVFGQ